MLTEEARRLDSSIDEELANVSENIIDAESDNVSTASSSSDDEEDQIKWFDKTNTIEERGSICSSNTSRRGGRGIQLHASSAEEDELYPRFQALATMTKLTILILQQLHAVRVLRPLTPRTLNRISCQCKC